MNFRDLVEKVREHDQHYPYDCDCLLCRLFRDLYETNYTIFFSPDVSRMNQEAYDAGKTAASADLADAEERGRREIADIVINAVLDIETTPRENWPSARDLLAKITQDCGLQSEVFPLLNMCRAKEAGE